jgi:D-alanyl-D-alanine carboxypeptidase/D-alanyl-D-alanine-endopeptidase (penicillin-binding protein 4)
MKQALIGIGSGLAAGSVVLGFMFLGPLSQSNETSEPLASQATVLESTESAAPVEIEPEPTTPEVIQCSVSALEDAAEILLLQAQVIDTSTGEVLFDRGSGSAARPASVMKLFTAAAALETLGPDYRVTTRVYQDTTWLELGTRLFRAQESVKIRSIKKPQSFLTSSLRCSRF